MKRITIMTGLIVAALAIAAPRARAAEKEKPKPAKTEQAKQSECSCPMCKMAKADAKKGGDADMKAMMQKMGMSPEEMKRCRMMMTMKDNAADPNAILALRKDLQLSNDQVELLQDIAAQARAKALLVLEDAQRAQVKNLPKEPATMKAMHNKMMAKMQKTMQKKQSPAAQQEQADLSKIKDAMAQMKKEMKQMKTEMETMKKHMAPMKQKMKEGGK